ncbi:EamA-like transporter family protein [Roseovarius sp. THAF27]|uniref:DMT family transporter n=1 Tax=unclassified Roseovarius TaxID=2614913 RepID=UPI0012686B2B|nr:MULTISPECIES: DMT family transporter [unclassified Roseovarius]QFT80291.1 EamA-like transporter family protein [Roseovarius sp. THAF27]QFT96581.1 EamA-like transporter family protein [Roseovarius sp. THAF8]
MKSDLWLYAILIAMGLGWGLTIPLAKIAVSTGHQPVGLIFWQLVVVVLCLGAVTLIRGRRIIFGRAYLRLFVMVALCGAVLPDVFFYLAAAKLPGGVMSIVVSSVAMFSLPIAVALGNERFEWQRLVGVVIGLAGIVMLVGPEASLPGAASAGFVLLALCAPALYATEGNLVALWGTQGLDPMQVILGASLVGLVICLPAAVMSGQWINPMDGIGVPELALAAGAALHALVYATYVWMVGRAGSVFTAQTSYMVTAAGVLWSMALLQESYAIWVWLALGTMMLGMFLVQPRAARVLVPGRVIDENAEAGMTSDRDGQS